MNIAEGSLNIPITMGQMLDLPKEERSKYLAMMPLTRTYVYNCIEGNLIMHIRKVIMRHGGIFREEYHYPGLSMTATFRDKKSMIACSCALAEWENEGIKMGLPRPQDYEGLLADPLTYGTEHKDPPALCFSIVNAIYHDRPITIKKLHRPHKYRED